MAERIQIRLRDDESDELLTLSSTTDQILKSNLVAAVDESSERHNFTVAPGNKQEVSEAIRGIESLLENPHLSVPIVKINNLIGSIEICLIPPVRVVGPESLMKMREIDQKTYNY